MVKEGVNFISIEASVAGVMMVGYSFSNTMLLPIVLMKSTDRFVQMFGLDSVGEGSGSQL